MVGEALAEGMGHPVSMAVSHGEIFIGFQDTSLRKTVVHNLTRKKNVGRSVRTNAVAKRSFLITAGTSSSLSTKFHPERFSPGDFASHHCGPVCSLVIYDM